MTGFEFIVATSIAILIVAFIGIEAYGLAFFNGNAGIFVNILASPLFLSKKRRLVSKYVYKTFLKNLDGVDDGNAYWRLKENGIEYIVNYQDFFHTYVKIDDSGYARVHPFIVTKIQVRLWLRNFLGNSTEEKVALDEIISKMDPRDLVKVRNGSK